MQKENMFFGVIFFPPKKKGDFRAIFLLFTGSVRSRPPGPMEDDSDGKQLAQSVMQCNMSCNVTCSAM